MDTHRSNRLAPESTAERVRPGDTHVANPLPTACVADLDGSGTIDAGDIDQLICLWGECTFW